MRRRVVALGLALAAAVALPVRADDPTEPKYADKPATWWIGEYLAGENPEAADKVLRRMGADAAPWIAIRLVATEKPADRRRLLGLVDALRETPPAVIAALRPSLRSGDSSEQAIALRIVVRARRAPVELADDVAALLASPSAETRRAAAVALGSLGAAAEPHVQALLAMVESTSEAERLAAVTGLGQIGTRAATVLPALLRAAAARPPNAVYLRALASIGPDEPSVADEIVRAVESGDERARSAANSLLCESQAAGDAIHHAALRLTGSKDPLVRFAAARAFGRVALARGSVPESLIRMLGDDDIRVVSSAASALEQCAAKSHSFAASAAGMFRVTKFPNAMTSLLLALRPESGPALLDAAVSDDKERRGAAWHVLVRVGERSIAVDPQHLIRMLLDTRVDLTLRRDMLGRVLSLQLIDNSAASEVCAAVVRKGDRELAAAAAHQLAGDSARRDALIAASAHPEPMVRLCSIRAMCALINQHDDVRAVSVAALGDEDASVRAAALETLSDCNGATWTADPAARDEVAKKLAVVGRGGLAERNRAIVILSRFPDDVRPAGALLAMLEFDDSAERVIDLLRRTPRCNDEVLDTLLTGPDPVLAARAARVLSTRRESAKLVDRVAGWIDSEDPRVAREGVLAAEALGPSAAVKLAGALIRAARAGVEGVAWPACSLLGHVAHSEPAIRDALLAVSDDPRNSAQLGVSQFLPELGEAGIQRLVALLGDPRRDAQRSACVAIWSALQKGKSGYAGAAPALERIAKGDDVELARFAQAALKLLPK